MKFNPTPSQTFLRACVDYDFATGLLTWKQRPRAHFKNEQAFVRWNNLYPNKEAFGYVHANGAKYGAVDNKWFYAHRIIWKWVTGAEPDPIPDHEDRNRTNNRWDNLRPATHAQNSANHSLRIDNDSGHAGVYFSSREKCWKAQITVEQRRIYLGRYTSKKAAIAVRQKAEKKYHGKFTPNVQELRA